MASLACTSCRAKKQRCDRVMPSCMQCINAQQPCRYPDQHKRGLPAGFLNAVESRLRETEDALFYALSELHEGTTEDGAYAALSHSRASSQNKSEMMDKWAKLPLGDRAQAKAWFLSQRLGRDEELESSSPTNLALAASRSGVQQQHQQSSSSSPGVIKTAQAGSVSHGGDMTPQSPRQTSPLLDASTTVPASHTHPRSHGWDALADKSTTAAPSPTPMTSAPNGSGLSARVKVIAEARKTMYF